MLMGYLVYVLTLFAALGCGLVGGAQLAFSDIVMGSLARIPSEAGVAAMREINAATLGSWVLRALYATGVLSVALMVLAVMRWDMPDSALVLLAGVAYLAGTVLVTIVCNAPRNDALAREGAVWPEYLATWTRWNHVRTASSLAAAALFAMAM